MSGGNSARAHFREAGSGTAVVCLHCSASTSGQWRPLMDLLADRYHVIAPDLYGSGRSPPWPGERPMWIDDQIELLAPALEHAGEGFHLVGHSYGGAIALKAALSLRPRLLSLTLYEPVLFSVLLNDAPESDAAREILAVRDDTAHLGPEGVAQRFIDYWMGAGTWAAMPESRRAALATAVRAMKPEWHSAFNEPTPLQAFRALDVPTLLLTGTASTAAARGVARLLAGVLPNVQTEELAGLAHMAPVTHPHQINPLIERFLAERQPSRGEAE
jgi:pimeloyl-ACP methyl ester carboxylesterase